MKKKKAGDTNVWCAYDKLVPIEEVTPRENNPNIHPDKQINLLAKVIKKQGWRAPITVSVSTGLITRGDGRLLAIVECEK